MKILDWIDSKKGMMVFLGSPGIGKTQLCASLVDWIHGNVPHYRYHHESKIFAEIKRAISQGWESFRYAESLADDFFVMYDDLGSASSSEWSSEVIFHVFDMRYNSGRPTLITSNLKRDEILKKYGQRTYDRLFDENNLVLEFHDLKSRRSGLVYQEQDKKKEEFKGSGMSN